MRKSIAVIGEGETEWFYFDSLRVSLLHFLPTLQVKHYTSYEELLPELQKYMPGYEKTKKYFVRTRLYDYLKEHGDIETAIKNGDILSKMAEESPQDKIAYSQVSRVLRLLEQIKKEQGR